MKNFKLVFLAFLFTVIGVAQSFQDEIQLIQSVYGKEKKLLLPQL